MDCFEGNYFVCYRCGLGLLLSCVGFFCLFGLYCFTRRNILIMDKLVVFAVALTALFFIILGIRGVKKDFEAYIGAVFLGLLVLGVAVFLFFQLPFSGIEEVIIYDVHEVPVDTIYMRA